MGEGNNAEIASSLEQKPMNRSFVVIGAVLIQLCLGAIYAWSVFTPALTANSPRQVIAVYRAGQLGIDQATYDEMNEALAEHNREYRRLSAEIVAAVEPEQELALRSERDGVAEQINEIARQYVPAERLEQLKYAMSDARTQAIFSAGLAAFAVVMVLAGRMMPMVGARALTIAGGVLLGGGYLLAGLIDGGSFPVLFVFIGLIGGAGIGLGYVVPIAVGVKWFPDKKGMIAGVAVAGFGFGALLWVQLADSWGHLIARFGLGSTFAGYGVVFFLMCIIGSIWMKNPPSGWLPKGYVPPEASGKAGKPAMGMVDFTSRQMLRTPQFYMIFFCFVTAAGAGLMSIGLMYLFPMQAMMARGLQWHEASAASGIAMAVCFSLANGIGRIAWGAMSDKLGRKPSIVIMLGTQGVLVIAFQWMAGTPALLYLAATLIGFDYGGSFALFPAITADTFGSKYLASNYPWVFLAYGIGGIFGPMLGGALGDVGNFPLAFTICGVLVLASAAVAALIKHPRKAPSPAAAA